MSTRKIHQFDNGVKVYDDHLLPAQRKRYAKRNVHEAEEEDVFIAIMKSIPADGCFVNVGSAIGYYTILAGKLLPELEIHAIEPLESHRKLFLENIELNELATSEIFLHAIGVARAPGTETLVDLGYGSLILNRARHAVLVEQFEAKGAAMKPIDVITLDTLCEAIGKRVDLLQMDVQGLEVDVLMGGAQCLHDGRISTLLIGTHGEKLHRNCIDVLTKLGFAIELEDGNTTAQPDGIIVASHGTVRRLNPA